MYAASRDQVIRDIEIKFTEYLRGHNQQVFNEINTLNRRLMYSTNEVTEYHAELMLASKEDEGATIRIEELERRGALVEHGARRIQARGLEIQEEYKDEVHHLQGLLGNTESRLQQMQHDSSLARSVAETLYKEGNEMQRNLESSIVEYRNQSELANFSHTHLEMASQRQAFAVNELTDENQMLSEALTHSRKQAELYENNMEQITREYRKKINEANNAKLESDLRHRNTEHDTVKRFANYRNTEAEAIAHLRFESSVSSNAREKMEHYEMLYDNERALTNELKTEIEDRNVKLRRSLQEGPMAIGHGSNQHAIQHLETEVKVAQVRAQDFLKKWVNVCTRISGWRMNWPRFRGKGYRPPSDPKSLSSELSLKANVSTSQPQEPNNTNDHVNIWVNWEIGMRNWRRKMQRYLDWEKVL